MNNKSTARHTFEIALLNSKWADNTTLTKGQVDEIVANTPDLKFPQWIRGYKTASRGVFHNPILWDQVQANQAKELEKEIEQSKIISDISSAIKSATTPADTPVDTPQAESSETSDWSPEAMALIPMTDPNYVAWGNFKRLKQVLDSFIFFPVYITGLTGNGKSTMVEQVCSKLARPMIRMNVTEETDEDDLLGSFRLLNGQTVWEDGPVVRAMKLGAVLLLDEVDLASYKIMALQPVLEGKPIYLKKINELVIPQRGFTVIATANTKGKNDGDYVGTREQNEAFLDRFAITLDQSYSSKSIEKRMLRKYTEDEHLINVLVEWANLTRTNLLNEVSDGAISTRRLIQFIQAYNIFGDKAYALKVTIARFDEEDREGFKSAFEKIDVEMAEAAIRQQKIANGECEEEEETEEKTEAPANDVDSAFADVMRDVMQKVQNGTI